MLKINIFLLIFRIKYKDIYMLVAQNKFTFMLHFENLLDSIPTFNSAPDHIYIFSDVELLVKILSLLIVKIINRFLSAKLHNKNIIAPYHTYLEETILRSGEIWIWTGQIELVWFCRKNQVGSSRVELYIIFLGFKLISIELEVIWSHIRSDHIRTNLMNFSHYVKFFQLCTYPIIVKTNKKNYCFKIRPVLNNLYCVESYRKVCPNWNFIKDWRCIRHTKEQLLNNLKIN
jgi:hypothetical protein